MQVRRRVPVPALLAVSSVLSPIGLPLAIRIGVGEFKGAGARVLYRKKKENWWSLTFFLYFAWWCLHRGLAALLSRVITPARVSPGQGCLVITGAVPPSPSGVTGGSSHHGGSLPPGWGCACHLVMIFKLGWGAGIIGVAGRKQRNQIQ